MHLDHFKIKLEWVTLLFTKLSFKNASMILFNFVIVKSVLYTIMSLKWKNNKV